MQAFDANLAIEPGRWAPRSGASDHYSRQEHKPVVESRVYSKAIEGSRTIESRCIRSLRIDAMYNSLFGLNILDPARADAPVSSIRRGFKTKSPSLRVMAKAAPGVQSNTKSNQSCRSGARAAARRGDRPGRKPACLKSKIRMSGNWQPCATGAGSQATSWQTVV